GRLMTDRPLSTYRLQISGSFPLEAAADVVGYLVLQEMRRRAGRHRRLRRRLAPRAERAGRLMTDRPLSTYRLQISGSFPLEAAADVVGYL
ncbi:hypothetical protein CTI14_64095, partial [Methylobacterium radiotolerans]